MGTKFGEKYGIEDYDKKLENQNNAILNAIKNESLDNKSVENAVKYFISDMKESFDKGKLTEYLKSYLKDFFKDQGSCSCVLKSSTGHMYFRRSYGNAVNMGNNIDKAVGYNIPGNNLFSSTSLVIDFLEFNSECALLAEGLGKDISLFKSNKDTVNCFLNDALRGAIKLVSVDNLWGPVNKEMLEDMLNDEKIYKEYMSQFKLFTEVE